jgi:hypothetical protein
MDKKGFAKRRRKAREQRAVALVIFQVRLVVSNSPATRIFIALLLCSAVPLHQRITLFSHFDL